MLKDIEKLIEKLIERYPNRLPTTDISSYELGKLVGQQDVIKHLVSLLEKETSNEARDVQSRNTQRRTN